ILPALSVIDRACSEAIARANRRVYRALVEPLTDSHRAKLDELYEICALSELKNALRSGDIWVKGSRQFRDFDDYLLPAEKFAAL
ncbi:hypothetical protein, partial [Escherichia coli]|uniref:hypothetical protein n=1 Tax=Escherichia coli TaxID=562 RepID=UPI002281461A